MAGKDEDLISLELSLEKLFLIKVKQELGKEELKIL